MSFVVTEKRLQIFWCDEICCTNKSIYMKFAIVKDMCFKIVSELFGYAFERKFIEVDMLEERQMVHDCGRP